MIKCNSSKNNCYEKCVIDMDEQQSLGGNICCDTAEDLDFKRKDILEQCEYAETIEKSNS